MSTHNDCSRLSRTDMAGVLSRALDAGALGSSDDVAIFYDLSRLDQTLGALKAAFPATTLHAVAVKSNPLVEVLKRIRRAGCGAEVASLGELQLARAAGFPAAAMVFDSPVKTRDEIELALQLGIGINANSLHELERIAELSTALGARSHVGLRINPETGLGTIADTSVAVRHSKFGVSLGEHRAAIARAFMAYPWLSGLHLHIGSQGMSQQQLLDGVAAVYDLYMAIRRDAGIHSFNIGGGLPARYRDSDTPMRFHEYACALRERFPELFGSEVSLVTELGRSVHASCGWVAARVEYVIGHGDGTTLFAHIGADMFLRKAYRPDDWHHDLSVCDAAGRLRRGPERLFHVAGPLCFAGDYLGRNVSLPASTAEGDYLLVHDAGAYTFSMWSTYNSRRFPAVIGYEQEGMSGFQVLRPRQSTDDIVAFWSAGGQT